MNKYQEEKNMKNRNDFENGVVYALSTLIRIHDDPSIALDVLKESGIDITKSSAPKYDLAPIYDALGITREWDEEEWINIKKH